MPYLGDYIGHLLSEITIARMHADLEAVRVAELYASHSLLRHMPVPHFRLPETDIDVPVVVKQVEGPSLNESPRGGASIIEMRETFELLLTEQFLKEGIKITPQYQKNLKSVFDERVAALSRAKETAVDVNRIADDFANACARTLEGLAPPLELAQIHKLEAGLKEEARLAFLKLRRPPPRLDVLVTTQEIRDAGPTEILLRIKLRITEQAIEWTTIESDGRTQDRLVPE